MNMKTAFKYLCAIAISAVALLSTSCADVEYPEHSSDCALQQIYMNVRVPQIDPDKIVYESIYGNIDEENHKVTFEVPYNFSDILDDVSDLSKTYLIASLPVSAIVTPPLGGLRDMTSPLNITVTAADGSENHYTLEAVLKKSSAANIETFSFAIGENVFTGIVDEANCRVTYMVPYPDLTELIETTPVIPEITVSPRAEIVTDITTPIDFSKDVTIQVKAQDGTIKDWLIVQAEPVILDKGFGYTKLKYTLSASQLGIEGDGNIRGMTVTKNYLVMHDRYFKFKLYDKVTGAYVGETVEPTDLTSTNKANSMYIDRDAEGNLVAGSFTSWTTSSAFVLYYYGDGETAAPKRILQVTGLGDCGRKFAVVGSLKKGTAYVYATKGKGNLVHKFRFVDGVYKDYKSITITAPNSAFAYLCTPIPFSNADDSDFLLIDHQVSGKGCVSRYSADGTFVSGMSDGAKCRASGVTTDGKIFTFNNATFLMYIDANSGVTQGKIRIYDISNLDAFTMSATHPDFNKFLVFSGEDLRSSSNGNGTAAVAYDIAEDGETCDVYMMLTSGGVMKYQLTKIAI